MPTNDLDRDDALPTPQLEVPLGDFTMRLRPGELDAVAAGLGQFDVSGEGNAATLAGALRRLPERDRAPAWALAMRRYGHGKPVEQAAAELGLDALHARALLDRYTALLTQVPAPEDAGDAGAARAPTGGAPTAEAAPADPAAPLEASGVARVMADEMLGNAIARGEQVDLDAAHEASLRAAEELGARDA